MRAILFLLFVVLLFLVVRFILIRINAIRAKQNAESETKQQAAKEMVLCAHCGLYMPREEAIELLGDEEILYFCSAEHQAAFKK